MTSTQVQLPLSYQEGKSRADHVYRNLENDLGRARTIYVGGTNAPGESEFLCKLYPALVFVDDYKADSSLFNRPVISTEQMAREANAQDFLINNCLTPAGFNHFCRQADSLGIPHCSAVEALIPSYRNGRIMSFPGLNSV